MTDRSVPVGDRNDEPVERPGPHLAREALAGAAPTAMDFGRQVVKAAKAAGWSVMWPGTGSDNGHPHLVFVRDDGSADFGHRVVAAWVTAVPLGWKVDEWKARLRRAGVQVVTWSPRDGMGPVEDVLGRRPGFVDRCGQPDPEGLDR